MWTYTDSIRSMARRRITALWLLLPAGGALLGMSGVNSPAGPTTPPEEWHDYDRVAYSQAPPEALREITVTPLRTEVPGTPELAGLPAHRSAHSTAFYVMRHPDTTHPGPWTTTIYVFGNKARPLHLKIEATNHISAGVRASWINEKLLWLQVWRERIVSTDLILNIETAQFLYGEEANYGVLLLPLEERKRITE
jgi:hypothetical protein